MCLNFHAKHNSNQCAIWSQTGTRMQIHSQFQRRRFDIAAYTMQLIRRINVISTQYQTLANRSRYMTYWCEQLEMHAVDLVQNEPNANNNNIVDEHRQMISSFSSQEQHRHNFERCVTKKKHYTSLPIWGDSVGRCTFDKSCQTGVAAGDGQIKNTIHGCLCVHRHPFLTA